MATNQTVVLIEWDPEDGSNCQSSFTLLFFDPASQHTPLENGYGCDV